MNQPAAALDLLLRVISGAPFDSNPVSAVGEETQSEAAEEVVAAEAPAQPRIALE